MAASKPMRDRKGMTSAVKDKTTPRVGAGPRGSAGVSGSSEFPKIPATPSREMPSPASAVHPRRSR